MVDLVNDKVAIFAVDPGTVSGVACGVFPLHAGSVWEGLQEGVFDAYEVEGTPTEQAWEIIQNYADWSGFPGKIQEKPGTNRIHLVFEDFVLRLKSGEASRRRLLDPVRVFHACDALCIMRDGSIRWAFPELQQPSFAKTFATDARLRKYGMWVKGSDHKRDAMRHLCRKYATIIGDN